MASNTESTSNPTNAGISSSQNYYDLLGITPEATDEEIRRAYRRTALRLRKSFFVLLSLTDVSNLDPDKNPDPEAATQFHAVDKAYKVLIDPQLRSTYDRLGPRGMRESFL